MPPLFSLLAAAVAAVPVALGALLWRGRVLHERSQSRELFASRDGH
ncbi:hypothetical protein [Rubrivirga sp.]